MALTLEALPALHGDSLLLHFGSKGEPQLIIVDGGPAGVYNRSMKPRLDEIKAQCSPDDPLPVRLIMVSHIDDDHIRGILDLADDLDNTAGQKLVAVQELWHNAFTDILGDQDDQFLQNSAGGAGIASVGGEVPALLREQHPSAAIIASVPQGKKLREAAKKRGWVLNDGRPLLMAGGEKDTIDAGGGLKLTLLGPSRDRLLALQKDWMKQIKKAPKKPSASKVVEYVDDSPPNLSSIIVLASDGKRKILLTGDGRGDFILEGIENAKLMKNGKFPVDVLKVPHHGSIRDLEADFFERIPAKDYVISADGKFANPDIETLELMLSTLGNTSYNIHLTYPVDAFSADYDRKTLQKLIDGSAKKNYKILPRDPEAKSVML
jgi:glyoxylase-like metal-dependent hydrolase (beta-lactamase superfamily II)